MSNLIQIKRSLTTAGAPSLANGELAFTANGDHLFIGSNGASITIAGKFNPGILTANQALVADGAGYLDAVKTANLTATVITANGGIGTAGQVLASNGSVIYWSDAAVGDVTAVTAGAGLTGGGSSGELSLAVGEGSGISVSADAIAVIANNGLSANATGVYVIAGSGIASNSTGVHVVAGNSTVVSNTTGVYVNSAALSIATSQLTGDVALGSSTSGNYVATLTAGAGISGSSSSEGGEATIAVVANNGIVSNTSGVFAKAANGISVDSAGINVTGGAGLVANSTGVHVVGANGISVDADTVGITTGSTLTVNSAGIHVNTSLSITDLTLSGNLTVSGTLTTIDTTNLAVKDPLIKLADGNISTDSLDTGFYSVYGSTGAKYTGLFRDATDGLYNLYTDLQEEPTNVVNTAATGYKLATLRTYLNSGGLVSNATNITITANSTLAVDITANTLSLSTPLAVGSGGLGLSSITSGAILVGNATGTATVLAAGTDGFVLQSNGTSVIYSTLDGGTF